MQLQINGEERNVACTTLAELLTQLAYTSAAVATAVDGEFVPRTARDTFTLYQGMRIDIVAPIQGG
ncbi:MAG: sulfur carrier protein ThiS [Pseudomonadales bacterium]|jgi:sulfur carrier protein|nr:sulfur carrier protein ThiS [Pseudomonadales bacterium]